MAVNQNRKDSPGQRIAEARRARSWTQEELAEQAKLTVRTIQRVENNETTPRLHTLRTLAGTLDIPFETLYTSIETPAALPAGFSESREEERPFLQLVNLSSFSYLLIPFVHFLVPVWLLRRRQLQDASCRRVGWKIVRAQIAWVAATNALMLLTLFYNLLQASYAGQPFFISYLVPFGVMYVLNGLLIFRQGKWVSAME